MSDLRGQRARKLTRVTRMQSIALEGLKVVSASEMALIEKRSCERGSSPFVFMQHAGTKLASAVQRFLVERGLEPIVTLLVGKGNNGGDAYSAGVELLGKGCRVEAIHLYPLEECSFLCQERHRCFVEKGGKVLFLTDSSFDSISLQGVLLDGLVGTGFQGRAEGLLASVIHSANASGLPILAVDIPSGLNGDTGEVLTEAIRATQTLCLGLPKSGFILESGWDYVGEIVYLDFGLRAADIKEAEPVAYLLNESAIKRSLPPLQRTRHKYQAGYVLSFAGSSGMPGAAILASYAALRSGAGIVRLFYPLEAQVELSCAPYELIRQAWDGSDWEGIAEEVKRAKSALIGPGMGRDKEAEKRVKKLLAQLSLPCVLDADALFFLAHHPAWTLPSVSVLTPHRKEMTLLLSQEKGLGSFEQRCQSYAEKRGVTLVVKGAVTWIFHPQTTPLVSMRGDPGMATAGAGDVLTGMIASLLAQGLSPRHAAALGVYLHGLSGECAAKKCTSYCMTASDLISCLPDAFFLGRGIE